MANTNIDGTNQALTMIEMLMVREAKELLQKTVLEQLVRLMPIKVITATKREVFIGPF